MKFLLRRACYRRQNCFAPFRKLAAALAPAQSNLPPLKSFPVAAVHLIFAFGLLLKPSALRADDTASAPPATTDTTNSVPGEGPSAYKKMSLEQLMNLDVTSVSKQAEPYGQAPAAIQVVTGDEIRRSGATSIPEALRLADNLDVAQVNSHDWAISARGFNAGLANKLLVLQDGRTLYTPLFSGVFWDVQDYLLADIDRIEVVSGPGGTLWGANAVNGVINITSKSAKDTQGLYVENETGSELQESVGARFGGTLASNVYYRIYGKYFDRGNENTTNAQDAGDSWRQGRGGFRIDAENSPGNLFTLQGDYYAGNENEPGNIGNDGVSGGNLLGRWTHTLAEDSDMSLQVYYDRTHIALPKAATAGDAAGTIKDDLDTYDVDFQHRFRLFQRNNIVWGLGYRFTHDVVDNSPSVTFEPPTLDRNLYSGFVQDEIMLFEPLFLTLGTKLEHNDYTGFEIEPSGRLQWNVVTNQMIWGAVSRAVREPSRVDRDEVALFLSNRTLLQGNPNFESEAVIAYELGYRAQLGSKVTTSLSAFYNDYTDIRSVDITPGTFVPLTFANNLRAETYGLELSVNYQVMDGWRLHAGYNLLKERVHINPGTTDFNNALNETADPEHQFNIRTSFDLPQNIELDSGLRWVDSLRINSSTAGTPATVPSYFELDARLAWHPIRSLEVALVGQNLLHSEHTEYGVPGAAGTEDIQRSVYGKVSWTW